MRRELCAVCLYLAISAWASVASAQQAVTQSVALNISKRPLAQALAEFAVQAGLKLVYYSELGDGLQAPAISGHYAPAAALRLLLSNTSLHADFVDAHTVVIRTGAATFRADDRITSNSADGTSVLTTNPNPGRLAALSDGEDVGPSSENADSSQDQANDKTHRAELEQVVVTGTHIHGAPQDSSQVIVYDRAAIEQSGATTLEDFSRQMPENFASVGSTNTFSGPVNGVGRDETGGNFTNGAAFNLHGFGAAETLTLVNGHRIASGGTTGQFVDISLIPLSAIERIEVLPDGASAIYGADAVAGVVNIILRSDYNGAETSVRTGAATEGGDQEATVSQVLGRTWSGGSVLAAYEYDKQDGLRADQRDFIPINFGNGLGATLLYPQQTRNSFMLTGSQLLGGGTTLSGDALYSQRKFSQDSFSPLLSQINYSTGTPKEYGATLDLTNEFLKTWRVVLSPSFYRTDQAQDGIVTQPSAALLENVLSVARINLTQIHVHADGTVASLPGGAIRAAAGGEFRRDTLTVGNSFTTNGVPESEFQNLGRNVGSAFGELLIPVIGHDNERAGLRRVEVSLAARYDHYTTGQAASTPRIGILWSPSSDLTLHGTYASAFVAPRLDQLAVTYPQYSATSIPNPASSTGVTDTLFRNGGNPALLPERSKTFTFGFDEKLSEIPGLSLSGTYFSTVFRNQILSPPIINYNDILHDPTLQPFINLSPNPAEIAQLFNTGQVADYSGPPPLGAAGVQATFDDRDANLGVSRQSGFDFSTAFTRDVHLGTLGIGLSGTYLIRYEAQNTSAVPITVLLNQLGEPINFRANATLSWAVNGLATALSIHYWNHYENPLFTPAESISSWTTSDLHIAYNFSAGVSPVLRGLTVSLDAQNVFDRPPPMINLPASSPFSPGYDGSNANPLGRVISLQLRKHWGGQ
jgi:iron complex outermembrane recepter protein